jgi:rare lipoprotein A
MEFAFRFAALGLVLFSITSCSTTARTEQQERTVLDTQLGDATFYSRSFQGDKTASGARFDNHKAMAAHRTYPFGTVVRVTNLRNGRVVNVVIVDRGPYGKNHREGTIIDLSRDAAEGLDMIREGQAQVKIDVLAWGQ